QLEPPLLTESLDDDLQIPLLSEIIEPGPGADVRPSAAVQSPPLASVALPYPAQPAVVPPQPPRPSAAQPQASASPVHRGLVQNRLDAELRAAAQLILQDVIDDFVPQIEAELKRRLDARLDRLLKQRKP